MPERKAPSEQAAAANPPAAFIQPYSPSWFDRLMGRIERLPGPWWLFYIVVGAVLVVTFISIQARAGSYRDGFIAWHIFLAVQPVLPLAAVHYLTRVGSEAVTAFRPAMVEPGREPELRYRLAVLPARFTLFVTFLWLVLMVLYLLQGPAGAAEMRLAPSAFGFWYAFAPLLGLAYGTFTAYAIHQVRELRRLFRGPVHLDLFHPDPLYAFSPLTARLAVIIAFITYSWVINDPTTFSDALSLLTFCVMLSLALAVFAFPLGGAHLRLVAEKSAALADNGARWKAAAAELHRRVDNSAMTRMDDLHKTLSSLDLERSYFSRVPTWPWQPETLRGLVAALVLPIVIWLVQFGLQRLLG